MKNFTLLSAAMVVSSVVANAQTISSSWVPAVGFSQTHNVVNLNGPIAPGSAGQGQTWNFAGATSDSSYTETNLSPLDAAGGSNFPLASYGVQVAGAPSAGFFVGSSLALQVIGSYAGDVSGAVTFTYDNAMDVMQFPASFSSAFNDPYHVNITSPFINFSIDGTNNVLVDGSGSLTTPAGTYNNVLRVKSINNYQYIGLPPLPGTVTSGTTTTYMWVSPDSPGYILMNYSINVEGTNSETTITYSANHLGTISGNGYSSSNNPAALTFSAISSGCPSFSYQWYSKSGVVSAPTGSSTIGWTLIPGATSNTFDPPTLFNSTSYACFVTPLSACGNAAWAGGVASFNITTSSGSVNGQQVSQCSFSSVPLTFDSQPVGLGNTTVQWYFANGAVSCPQGNATSGWTAIAGAITSFSSFIPPSSGTYILACLVTPEGITGLPAQWANGCKTVVVNSFTAQTIIGNPNIIPFTPYLYLVSQTAGNTYTWSAYGGAISSGQGSNQVNVVWAATGPYQVMLIENNGVCSDTSYLDVEGSSITQFNETELTLSNIHVFPNPTDVGFTIQSNAILDGESIELLDQVGRVVLQTNAAVNSTYVSTAHLAQGIYFLRLPNHPGYSQKLILN